MDCNTAANEPRLPFATFIAGFFVPVFTVLLAVMFMMIKV